MTIRIEEYTNIIKSYEYDVESNKSLSATVARQFCRNCGREIIDIYVYSSEVFQNLMITTLEIVKELYDEFKII